MNNRSSIAPSTMARRQFIKMTAGAATLGAFGAARAAESEGTRHVWVLSDLHAGRIEGEKDGAEWFRLACEDMKTAYPSIAYALTLGDLTQHGREEQIGSYIKTRDGSGIKTWYELAGNHEYSKGELELKRGAKEIVAHRRRHDTRSFVPEFKVQVPLRHPIQFGAE